MRGISLVLGCGVLVGCGEETSRPVFSGDCSVFVNRAVLRGLQEDGADPRLILAFLARPSPHFIPKCPLCEPVKSALGEYTLHADDPKWAPTGSGFPKEIAEGLSSPERKLRLLALQELVDRYVTRAIERSGFSDRDRARLAKLLEQGKAEGMEIKNKHLAEAYLDFGPSCPSCSGAARPRK